MKRYSKKVREEAALICAIAASGGVWSPIGDRHTRVYSDIFRALGDGLPKGCLGLAVNAYACLADTYQAWPVERDAEASSMILDGWSPE